ncbi:MAG: hypothetical protein JNK54_03620 [Elusimicrobia bacterium]|jgi:hypothetical protein|nr:hypothetical protein [Elusimicrobiota bacterium]
MLKKDNLTLLVFNLLALLIFPFLAPAQAGEPRVKKADPSIRYWYQFRSALLENNIDKLISVTYFPFEITTSDGKIEHHSRTTFPPLYHLLMDTEIGKETMRPFLLGKEELTREERNALKNGEIKIGSFRFRNIKGKLYFVGAKIGRDFPLRQMAPETNSHPSQEPHPTPSKNSGVSFSNSARTFTRHSSPTTPEVRERVDVFRFFWITFRQAALDNNTRVIQSITKFPFETKGPLEDDRKKKFIPREFERLWPRLMEADPHSWGPLRDSMKALIARREEPTAEELKSEPTGHVQIGIFLFRKIKERWYFSGSVFSE